MCNICVDTEKQNHNLMSLWWMVT